MNCLLCKTSNLKPLLKGNNWTIFQCSNCDLSVTKRAVAPNYSHYHRDIEYEESEKLFNNIFKGRIKLLQKYINVKGKVLDIGCSTGIYLNLFKEKGWETYGIEPSTSYKIAEKKGLRVYHTTLEKYLSKDKFDLVIMNHTLEHLPNPNKAIQKIHSLLNPKGYLYIDVPNFDSIGRKLYKNSWKPLLPYEHDFHYNKKSLTYLLERYGFDIVKTASRSGLFEFDNMLEELFTSLISGKKRFFESILSFPYSFISTMVDRGDSISVIAKKT